MAARALGTNGADGRRSGARSVRAAMLERPRRSRVDDLAGLQLGLVVRVPEVRCVRLDAIPGLGRDMIGSPAAARAPPAALDARGAVEDGAGRSLWVSPSLPERVELDRPVLGPSAAARAPPAGLDDRGPVERDRSL